MSLTNNQYSHIEKVIEARRQQAILKAQEAKKQAYVRLPELSQLDKAITARQAEKVRAGISQDTDKGLRLQQEIDSLTEEKKAMMANIGLSWEYLFPRFTCPDCRDTGFIDGEKCHCFRQLEAELIYDASNIRELLEKENFSTFDFSYFTKTNRNSITGKSSYENMKANYDKARAFVENFPEKKGSMLFTGAPGTGKTFLSNCIAKSLIDEGFSVVYLTAQSLFDKLINSAFGKCADERDRLFGCDLLIIDDLGTEMNNSLISSQLFNCITERKLRSKGTIISTNYDMNRLRDEYSERVTSRLLEDYTICRFYNEDIRIIKHQTQKA